MSHQFSGLKQPPHFCGEQPHSTLCSWSNHLGSTPCITNDFDESLFRCTGHWHFLNVPRDKKVLPGPRSAALPTRDRNELWKTENVL